MKYGKGILVLVFSILMIGGTFVADASAQRRANISVGRRPVIVPVSAVSGTAIL